MPTPTSLHMSKMMLSMTLGGTMPSVTSTTFTGDKFERIGKMQREFYRWMGDNKSEFTNMMVISREAMELASSLEYENTHHNILFANPLNPLKKACGCRYGAGSEDPSAETWVWETLAVGGDPITKTDKEEEVRCNVEG
ncbi:hypothetical protein Bca52824_077891 [Brassica carinata]|uniref:Uncharacterized protein n=1 Tax=Brassica carinata TaxID=52824 RepID=A0A8X7PXM4_BRACI|nr:hypothetical protein Bca52824_077891 [Brassica carinata]